MMKRITILAGILVLVLALTYTQANASPVTFSLAYARAGQDRDFDRFLAEADDGPWKASAKSSSLSLGGLSSFSLDSNMDLESGRARSLSIVYQPLRVTKAGTQRIEFAYSGLLEISSNNASPDCIGPYVGYSLGAFDDQRNKFWDNNYLNDIDSRNINDTFAFEYELDVGDEIQFVFFLNTFANLKIKYNGLRGDDFADLNLLADFSNSFDIFNLDGLVVVPIPSAALLMGPALLVLAGLRRRKR
jgi:hypothetical protein